MPSYTFTHYELYPIFPKLKVLWIYTIVVSFINLAFVVVKLQIFSFAYQFSTHEMPPLPTFFKPWSNFAEIFTSDSTLAGKNSLNNLSKI